MSEVPPASDALPPGVAPLPQEVPPTPGPKEAAEATETFNEKGQKLDHALRSVAGYGALALVLLMYGCGLGAIGLFLGLWPCIAPRATAEMWHIVVAVLVALFSVPTVLLLSVLRSTSLMRRDAEMDSIHAVIGQKFMDVLEKFATK